MDFYNDATMFNASTTDQSEAVLQRSKQAVVLHGKLRIFS